MSAVSKGRGEKTIEVKAGSQWKKDVVCIVEKRMEKLGGKESK